MHSYRVETENLREQSGKKILGFRSRWPVGCGGGREIGCGKRCAVEFSVNRQRNGVEHHHRRRHHVRRQALACMGEDVSRIDTRSAIGNHVADQPIPAVAVPDGRHRLGHARVRLQCHLDFPEFDAEPTDFDLGIGAPEILQPSVGRPPHAIARAIDPRSRRTEGICDKLRGGQRVSPVIAASESRPGKIQLPRDTYRYRSQTRVQHYLAESASRCADSDRVVRSQCRTDARHDSCLGRTVGVEHLSARSPAGHQFRRTRFPTCHDTTDSGETVWVDGR